MEFDCRECLTLGVDVKRVKASFRTLEFALMFKSTYTHFHLLHQTFLLAAYDWHLWAGALLRGVQLWWYDSLQRVGSPVTSALMYYIIMLLLLHQSNYQNQILSVGTENSSSLKNLNVSNSICTLQKINIQGWSLTTCTACKKLM